MKPVIIFNRIGLAQYDYDQNEVKVSKLKVLAAMSGGVDSTVAACLLIEQGFEVTGFTMNMTGTIHAEKAGRTIDEAREASKALGIRHVTRDVTDIFNERVLGYFSDEYGKGRTPNPCVRCNDTVKFEYLYSVAQELGCDSVATGHYARCENGRILRGADRTKDQSYFLYLLYKRDLSKLLFPCGELTKKEVRGIAERKGLRVAHKEESQDICFVPDGEYAGFLRDYSGNNEHPGQILDSCGRLLGAHKGIMHYTVGQRKGLGALGKRMFVKELHPQTNTVIAGPEEELYTGTVRIGDVVTGPFDLLPGMEFDIQIRYRSTPVRGVIESMNKNDITITFGKPVRAVAPGQSGVLYRDDVVIAGGILQ
jgi:tRNA-uridine 2-sulfurtransferase